MSFWIWIGLLERNNPSDGVVIQADGWWFLIFFLFHELLTSSIDRKFEHPNYGSLDYDFALLRLSQAIDFTNPSLDHVYPACWPSSEPTIAGQRVNILE